jgi:D-arabinose 1-dehydrogenase-like Zn-dependent alcohol dehydrogenase
VAREVHVAGALMLAAQRYPTLFGLLARGDIDLDPVIYREIGVDDVQEAFDEMSEFGNAGRFVVTDFS